MNRFIKTHGRPFVALLLGVFAWASVFISVYVKALVLHSLDVARIMEAAGILTGSVTAYAAGAAYVKANTED